MLEIIICGIFTAIWGAYRLYGSARAWGGKRMSKRVLEIVNNETRAFMIADLKRMLGCISTHKAQCIIDCADCEYMIYRPLAEYLPQIIEDLELIERSLGR